MEGAGLADESPDTEVLTRSVARKEASIADEKLHLQLDGKQARWTARSFGPCIHTSIHADAQPLFSDADHMLCLGLGFLGQETRREKGFEKCFRNV